MESRMFVYARKSDEDKHNQIQSIPDQLKEVERTRQEQNLPKPLATFTDIKTAKTAGVRIGFNEMVERIKKGEAKTILCWKANRLARNGKEGGELIYLVDNFGVSIITCFGVFSKDNCNQLWNEFGIATQYSKDLSIDVKRGMKTKVEKGWRPGLAPLGYRNCKEMDKGSKEIEPDMRGNRFDLCCEWWKLMLSGKYTIERTVKIINGKGLRSQRGQPVSLSTAYRFFNNVFYAGYFNYYGSLQKGSHRPMVTMAEFKRVRTILKNRGVVNWSKTGLPFVGFIKCPECQATVTGETHTKYYKNGKSQTFIYYRCSKKLGSCSQKYLSAKKFEEQVLNYINSLELDTKYIEWVRAVLKRVNSEQFEFDRKQKEVQTKKLMELSKRKEKLFDMRADGIYSEDEYQAEKKKTLEQEAEIKSYIVEDTTGYWEKVRDNALNFAERVAELFNQDDPEIKKLVVQILGSNLSLFDQKLVIEPKSAFIFLKDLEKDISQELSKLEPTISLPQEPNLDYLQNYLSNERVMGIEPTLFHLASGRFTTKLHPQSVRNYIPDFKQQTSTKLSKKRIDITLAKCDIRARPC